MNFTEKKNLNSVCGVFGKVCIFKVSSCLSVWIFVRTNFFSV
uniref:Uncharacterized protein n=1 Tax=Anguilla anguilla TaxID=7936 RepID=A0A0E9SWV1_ANGAN